MYWKVSVGLRCVCTSRIDSFLNLSRFQLHVSKKAVSVSETSAVNFMVGWWLFASSMNEYISSLSTFHNENMSLINLFHTSGLCGLLLIISVNIADIKSVKFIPMYRQMFLNQNRRTFPLIL